ncbi:MAG: hypothetical protein ACJZ12_00915 [Candidatus Neomarinimicrobiota bacterium]
MIIMILGMHRSGTSTLAGIMHMNNIVMGTYQNFWPRPLNQNPKGFYENYDFRKINDRLLNNSGYDVKSYITDIPEIDYHKKLSKKMRILIKESNLVNINWGWKDPRTCLTAFHWEKTIDSLNLREKFKVVFMVRRASSVSRSLKKRNNLSLEKGLQLWKVYNERAIKFCMDTKSPIYFCSFEDLLENPIVVCNSLFAFMGLSFDFDKVKNFIEPSISTSAIGDEVYYPSSIIELEEKIYSFVNEEK